MRNVVIITVILFLTSSSQASSDAGAMQAIQADDTVLTQPNLKKEIQRLSYMLPRLIQARMVLSVAGIISAKNLPSAYSRAIIFSSNTLLAWIHMELSSCSLKSAKFATQNLYKTLRDRNLKKEEKLKRIEHFSKFYRLLGLQSFFLCLNFVSFLQFKIDDPLYQFSYFYKKFSESLPASLRLNFS